MHDRRRECAHQAGGALDVSGGQGVRDRPLAVALRLAPVGGLACERRRTPRLEAIELAAQELADEPMVAVAAARPSERHEEGVVGGKVLEQAPGAVTPEHAVAQRPGERVEHGRADEEDTLDLRAPAEVLLAQVLRDVWVGAADGVRRRVGAGGEQREGGQVEPRGPTLAALVEPRGDVLGDLEAGGVEQRVGLPPGQREVGRAELEELARRAPARDRQDAGTAREHDLHARWQVLGE